MKLLELKISNFKGINHFILLTNGENMNIYGNNGTGKTSVCDAFMWLLFDKDSTDRKSFSIKPLNKEGNVKSHGAEICVSACIKHNGIETEYCKIYREKWTKTRGKATEQLSGNETLYYIDDLSVKKAEYENAISTMCSIEKFKMVTNPFYFAQSMKWQDRRSLLFQMCGGELSEADIINSNPVLNPLLQAKGKHDVDTFKKKCVQDRAKLNKQLEEIPVRISELSKQLVQVDINVVGTKAKIAELEMELKPLEEKLQAIINGSHSFNMKNQITAKENELYALDNENNAYKQRKRAEYQKDINADNELLMKMQLKKAEYCRQIKDLEVTIAACLKTRAALLEEYHQFVDKEPRINDTCPTCGQTLPEDMLSAALANFNKDRSEGIAKNIEEGKANNKKKSDAEKEMEQVKDCLEQVEMSITQLQEKINNYYDASPFEETDMPGYSARKKILHDDIEALKIELESLQVDAASRKQPLEDAISSIREKIKSFDRDIIRYEEYQVQINRVQELEQDEVKVAEKVEQLDGYIYLCEEFIKQKISVVEENINNCFKIARFKLFDTQINGGINETCEVTYNGVPYADINDAAKVNVGIDIINSLSNFFVFNAPIFIDNAESVTKLEETESQVIRLIVSEADAVLRTEVASRQLNSHV